MFGITEMIFQFRIEGGFDGDFGRHLSEVGQILPGFDIF